MSPAKVAGPHRIERSTRNTARGIDRGGLSEFLTARQDTPRRVVPRAVARLRGNAFVLYITCCTASIAPSADTDKRGPPRKMPCTAPMSLSDRLTRTRAKKWLAGRGWRAAPEARVHRSPVPVQKPARLAYGTRACFMSGTRHTCPGGRCQGYEQRFVRRSNPVSSPQHRDCLAEIARNDWLPQT